MTTKDLVLLVADKNLEGTLRGLLSRSAALGLRSVAFDLFIHPERDPGCYRHAHEFLRPFIGRYEHTLVVFDREGCGREEKDRLALEADVETRLRENGWSERAAAVVVDPELEVWVWSGSPHVETALGWRTGDPPFLDWLRGEGLLERGALKPARPKEAVERALRLTRRPRSSALYSQLARNVSTERCVDPSFAKLRSILQRWFPSVPPPG
jgi:hypothetical protein